MRDYPRRDPGKACPEVGPAEAQELETYGEASGWDVMIDPSKNLGCLIQGEFDNGSLVRIGFDKNSGGGYVTAFNYDWGDIQEGAVYPVAFDLDGETYQGEATAVYLGDAPGVQIDFDNLDFFLDIMRRNNMVLFNENGEVMTISLAGTFNAMEFAMECQQEVDASR